MEFESTDEVGGGSSSSLSAAAGVVPPPGSSDETHAALKSELVRLRTFAKWPLTYIRPKDLAKTGFVYTGRLDCVRCVFCG